MLCVAGLMNLPAPPTPPTVIELDGDGVQRECRNQWVLNKRRIYGCYKLRTRIIYIDSDRVNKHETLAHEIAHDINNHNNQRWLKSEIRWVASKAEVWCR